MGAERFALIGDPVAGSVSPAMQRAAFRAAGLDHDYVAVRVPARELEARWPDLAASCRGLNVTIPHKERVVPLLDEISPEAARIGSVNTVVLRDGRAEGHSTDGAGFMAALRRAGLGPHRRAVILGSGGAARAVAAALRAERTAVVVAGRTPARTRRLAEDLGVEAVALEPGPLREALADADLLVNATPLGGRPKETPLPVGVAIPPGATVFDLVYRPRRTALLARAEARGCAVVEGVEMLVEQGALSFEIWTGAPAPVEAMREAALRALGEASGA